MKPASAAQHLALLVSAALCTSGSAVAGPQQAVAAPRIPVNDYCNPLNIVSGIRSDGYLSVRVLPDTGATEIYRLRPGHQVWVCAKSGDGKWLGVLFKPRELGDTGEECVFQEAFGTRAGTRDHVAVAGPCLRGWVSARYIENTAG